ncbi:putative bifunctional diguanylate cyclase/phosphodiesterase [Neptunicella sp. SCSIO 80796]|uniref:putative bifunctional diguanylate cyclase/phosphodiesterase n=1 Tax=Neptunicella plasticusilytica TaxID=3117012 RepID=UPI003A4E258A
MLTLLQERLYAYLMLDDNQAAIAGVDSWRVSALRIILISSLVLCLVIVIHSSVKALQLNLYHVLLLTLSFYLMATSLLWLSKRYYKVAACGLILTIFASGICINLFIKDPELSKFGFIYMYTTTLLAFALLGARAGIVCMLFNIVPLVCLLNDVHLGQYLGLPGDLSAADFYIQSLVFLLFNISIPLAIARASIAAKRVNMQIMEKNDILNRKNDLYRSLFVDSEVAKFVVDDSGIISEMNDAADTLLQCDFRHRSQPLMLNDLFAEVTGEDQETLINRQIGSKLKVFKITRHPIHTQGNVIYTIQDISAKILLEKAMKAHTYVENRYKNFDELSGLPNRMWFEKKVTELPDFNRQPMVIVVIKLANSHFIEQKYGSAYLPQLIKFVVNQWRETVSCQYLLASIDPASIVVAMPDINKEQGLGLLNSIWARLPTSMPLDNCTLPIEIRMGIVFFHAEKYSVERLINNALYAVISGNAVINVYEGNSQRKFIEKEEINLLLVEAIHQNELYVVYQPKVDRDGRLVGLEALLRWSSKVIGAVSPAVFVPIAEDSGVITKLTHWLIDNVCRQIRTWQDEGLDVVPVAINISGIDLEGGDFHKHLIGAVVEHKIKPQYIELELTESALTSNVDEAVNTTRYLSEWGFCITLDDFGVGYSGLSKLTTYPVDRVKIDRQFISNIHLDNKKIKVVEAIVAMCQVFNIEVLAEGVEQKQEVSQLITLGCNNFQGYAFARPQSVKSTSALLAQPKPQLSVSL